MTALGRSEPAGVGRTGALTGVVVGLVVAAPVLRPGYVLSYDQVAVPTQPITATTLGLDGSVPRAVPTDLVLAAFGHLLPADVVQKVELLLVFVLAAWGVARLVPGRWPGFAAALFYTWNAYVAERLVIGHWSMLLGYAILPWAVGSAVTARREPTRLFRTCLWLFGAALCGVTPGLIVTAVVLLVLLWPGAPRAARLRAGSIALAWAVAANAPWWVPALLRPGGIPADPRGVDAFAAHADTSLGLAGSLLTLGGIWNTAVVPPERSNVGLATASLVGVVVVVALGARGVARAWDGAGAAVLVTGAAALLVAAAASLPGVDWLVRMVVVHVPGGGVLRDAQKYLAPAALSVALCVGAAVQRLVHAGRPVGAVLAAAVTALPVVVLPGLAWGVAGRLTVAHYPSDWFAVRRIIAASPARGDVAVFPWNLYRRFPWDGNRVVLDPAPRFFPRRVVVNDDLPLRSVTISGEDARAARIGRALATTPTSLPAVLSRSGVRFVVVERRAGRGGGPDPAFPDQRPLYAGRDLLLYQLSGVGPGPPGLPAYAVLGLIACALSGLMAGALALAEWHSERNFIVGTADTGRVRDEFA